jgi:hypothetical protein
MGQNLGFVRYLGLLADRPIDVGQTVEVDWANPEDPKNKAKGTVKLESVTDGKARLLINIEVSFADAEKPVKVTAHSTVDVASGKVDRTEGTATNLPPMGQASFRAVQFSIERKPAT